MPRKPRQLENNAVYHLISRGNNRLGIFEVEGGYQHFLELMRLAKIRFNWRMYHYCLMPNHFHLMAEVPLGEDLPRLMHYLLTQYARWYRFQTVYQGHLWTGRYRSPIINRESYMLECGRYIERNPVRARIASYPEAYLWSSYRFYGLGKPDKLIDEDPYYTSFGASSWERQKNYRAFVELPSNAVPASSQVPF